MLKQACQSLLAGKPTTLEEDLKLLTCMTEMTDRDEMAELAVQWRMSQKRQEELIHTVYLAHNFAVVHRD